MIRNMTLLAIMSIFSLALFAGDHNDPAHAKMEKVDNMACELTTGEACTAIKLTSVHCECGDTEKVIGKALNSVQGVTMAAVDIKNQKAHVHYKTADVKTAELEKAVATAGFDASDKAEKETQAQQHACCAPKAE